MQAPSSPQRFGKKIFGQNSLKNYGNTFFWNKYFYSSLKKKSGDILFKNLTFQKPLVAGSWPLCQEKCSLLFSL